MQPVCSRCAELIGTRLQAPKIPLHVLFGGIHARAPFDAAADDIAGAVPSSTSVIRHHYTLFNSPDVEDKVRAYRSLLHWANKDVRQEQGEVDERAREIATLHFDRIVDLVCQISTLLVRAQLAAKQRDITAYRNCVEGAMDRSCRLPQFGFSTAARMLSFMDPQRFGGLDPALAERIEAETAGRWAFEWFGPIGHRLTAASPHNRACFVRWLAHLQTMRRSLDAQRSQRRRATGSAFQLHAIEVEFALAAR